MRNATDYYNLLTDTLRKNYHQVKFIYDRVDKARSEGKYINIRTGFIMDPKNYKNYNCFYRNRDIFPLCYNMSCCGCAGKEVLNKIFDFYQNCLLIYQQTKDENRIKNIVENEVYNAKISYKYLNKQNNGKNDFKLINVSPLLNETKENENSYNQSSYSENNESDSMKNFIDDREIEEESEEVVDLNEEEEEEEENLEDELITLKDDEDENEDETRNTKKKKKLRKKNKYKEEFEDLLDDSYIVESENFNKKEEKSENLLCQKRKNGIINDDESEREGIGKLILKNLKEEKEEKKNDNNEIKNNEKNKNKIKNKKYFRENKENINLKQKTLDAFLRIIKK